jgi:hypothetical protein
VIERGGAIPTLFHLTGGQWKMVIPAQGYQKTPLYHTTRYYNRFCKGTALRTRVESMSKITNASGGTVGLDPVGAHVYAQEGGFTVLLISRDFEHDYVVQVDLPDELQLLAPESAMKYVITGDHFSDRDAVADSSMVSMADSLLVHVPRHSMVLLTFGAEGEQIESLPLGYYDYVSATSVEIYAYNTEVFDISGPEKKILLHTVTPDDVFSDALVWTVETNGVNVIYGLKSYGFEVMGSGTCDGNGTITVRATAWDNPEVYDEVTINISNQGTDCQTGARDPSANGLKLFPNPAGEKLFLTDLPPGTEQVLLTDLAGKRCHTAISQGGEAELDISHLEPGYYYVTVVGNDVVLQSAFIKQ